MAAAQFTASRAARHQALMFAAGAAAAVLLLLGCNSALLLPHTLLAAFPFPAATDDEDARTFYDDPAVSYAVGRRVTGWDAKRAEWLRVHRARAVPAPAPASERVVMVSGSQPGPCRGPAGDHLMLRFLKNKLDYCRLQGIELLYNMALLDPAMGGYWAKIPVLRAAMLAHPDAEWIWWVDSDAAFTDMDFSLPLAKYGRHNLVLYGWPDKLFGEKSWLGLNNGVFLIRNCQWSLDFLDAWARMSPASPDHAEWSKVVRDTLTGEGTTGSDDQSALVYLILQNSTLAYIETEYYLQGYWAGVVDQLDAVAARYEAAERGAPGEAGARLRRRHAEREHLRYAAVRNAGVGAVLPGPAGGGGGGKGWRRPFVTHFVGCQPCGGGRNPMYPEGSCEDGMRRALNFADDQVLRAYGSRHEAPLSDGVLPLPFGYPAAADARKK